MAKMVSYQLPLRKKNPSKRIFEVDVLRGVAIFLMVLVHVSYTIGIGWSYLLKAPSSGAPAWISSTQSFFKFVFISICTPAGTLNWRVSGYNEATVLYSLEAIFAGMFMFLCGISCAFSKLNLKRSFQLFFVANALSFILEFADLLLGINIHIWLGILNSLSLALLLYTLFDHFFKKWWQSYLVAILLAIINGFIIFYAYQGRNDLASLSWNPKTFAEWLTNWGSLLVGLVRYGDDYFSPLLVTNVVFLGATVGKTLYRNRKSLTPDYFPKKWAKPFLFLGRHTLVIYVLHQVLTYIIIILVLLPFGYTLNI